MRPFNVKLLGCIGLILISAMVIHGCGSGNDLLDEVGGRNVFELVLSDAGEEGSHEIDIVQNPDCDGDLTTSDPEDFTELDGIITVTVAADAPGLTLLSYVVHYHAVPGVDTVGVVQVPPAIASKQGQFNSFFVDSGDSYTDSLILMTIDQKYTLVDDLAADATYTNVATVLYNIEVEITFQDYEGNTSTKSLFIDANMGGYDNC
jgi:hypothetical protein